MTSPVRLAAMDRAIRSGDLAKVQLLLKAGVPAEGGHQGSFLEIAAMLGHLDMVVLLHGLGARPDLPDLLYTVVESSGDPAVARWLLDLEPRTQEELDQACRYAEHAGHERIVELLVEKGALAGAVDADPVAAVRATLEPASRDAWRPVLARGEDDPRGSKFGGVPRLGPADVWPVCGYCGEPLQLLVQLDLGDTPLAGSSGPDGFLQVFYCCRPDTFCEQAGDDAFSAFGAFMQARVYILPDDAPQSATEDRSPTAFEPARIVDWSVFRDLPTAEEPPENTGITLREAERELLGAHFDAVRFFDATPTTWLGDKLLGWPIWLQDYAPTACPDCGEPMMVLGQIASNDSLPYAFGDGGIAHITRCTRHPHRVGFAWAGS